MHSAHLPAAIVEAHEINHLPTYYYTYPPATSVRSSVHPAVENQSSPSSLASSSTCIG